MEVKESAFAKNIVPSFGLTFISIVSVRLVESSHVCGYGLAVASLGYGRSFII